MINRETIREMFDDENSQYGIVGAAGTVAWAFDGSFMAKPLPALYAWGILAGSALVYLFFRKAVKRIATGESRTPGTQLNTLMGL